MELVNEQVNNGKEQQDDETLKTFFFFSRWLLRSKVYCRGKKD